MRVQCGEQGEENLLAAMKTQLQKYSEPGSNSFSEDQEGEISDGAWKVSIEF